MASFTSALLFILLAHGAFCNWNVTYEERECGRDINNLWLDIVLVVDTSKGMTNGGLNQLRSTITSIFGDRQTFGENNANPRSIRVSIVTYNKDSEIVTNWNRVQSEDDFIHEVYSHLTNVSNVSSSYLYHGLLNAEKVLIGERGGSRRHYKKLIIVFASSFQIESSERSPVALANRLRGSKISVATVGFQQDKGSSLLKELEKISSTGLNFTNEGNTVTLLQDALVQVNCFCPEEWFQMKTEQSGRKLGTCIHPQNSAAGFRPAKYACAQYGGHLNNEKTLEKVKFVTEKMESQLESPKEYLLGLSIINGEYRWEGSNDLLGSFTNWAPGHPQFGKPLVLSKSFGIGVNRWESVDSTTTAKYFCEIPTCDSTRYCGPELFNFPQEV